MVDATCSECGANDWRKADTIDYPERRRERDRTTKEIYVCNLCGKHGRRFTDGKSGYVRLTGAMR